MANPLVSVVIPVYNGEPFLSETIDSILEQDYEPLEVIAIDDGSTDASADILRTYAGIRTIHQRNSGPSAARNRGLAEATGTYVAFVDSDDVLPRSKLSLQVGYLIAHPEIACVLGRQHWITPPPDAVPDKVWGDLDGIPLVSMVSRRDVLLELGGYDAELRMSEDFDLLVRLRERGYAFTVLPEIVVHRRYHGGNIAAGSGKMPIPLASLKAKLDRERGKTGNADR